MGGYAAGIGRVSKDVSSFSSRTSQILKMYSNVARRGTMD